MTAHECHRSPQHDRAPVIAYPDGPDAARVDPAEVAARCGMTDARVLLGWTPDARPWLASPALRGTTIMAGYALAAAVADGRLRYLPVRLSAVPSLIAAETPDVAVVAGVRRGGELAFRGSVGWGPAAARAARTVIVEVDPDAPDLGGPLIPGDVSSVIERPNDPSDAHSAPRSPDEVELAIGRRVVSLLPPEPTLQFGPGGIAEAVVASLDRPVHLWSGLLTDTMAALASRELLLGPATAAYVWGGEPIARLAAAGLLRLVPVEESHDLSRLSAMPRFVACNTALQVAVDGSVNVERVGRRVVAGIGGHADFCAGAARAAGGLAVVALRSTDRRGASTIVPSLDVVSTPRCDVSVVVTEHGVADLRGADDEERAHRIVDVAAPQHRAALALTLA